MNQPKTTDLLLGVALGSGRGLMDAPSPESSLGSGNINKAELLIDWLLGACIAFACSVFLFPDAFGSWAITLARALQPPL